MTMQQGGDTTILTLRYICSIPNWLKAFWSAASQTEEEARATSVDHTLQSKLLMRSCGQYNVELSYRVVYRSKPHNSFLTFDFCVFTVPPLMVRLKNEQHPLSADTSYEIVCEVIGARPKPNVTWWLDAKQLHTAKEPVRQCHFFNIIDNLSLK